MKANRGLNYIHAGYSIDRVHMHACFFFTTSYLRTYYSPYTYLTYRSSAKLWGVENQTDLPIAAALIKHQGTLFLSK
jgi:hypothetical protein